jgi:hypothetical protein
VPPVVRSMLEAGPARRPLRDPGPSPQWLGSYAQWRGGAVTRDDLIGTSWARSAALGAEGRCAPMLSDTAVAILAFLRTIAAGGACGECIGVYVGVERLATLESIRELVNASRILCTYGVCDLCRQRRLVARVWRAPPIRYGMRIGPKGQRRGGNIANGPSRARHASEPRPRLPPPRPPNGLGRAIDPSPAWCSSCSSSPLVI